MRKILLVLLALAFVFAVIGCNSGDTVARSLPYPPYPVPPSTILVEFAASGAGTTQVVGGNNLNVTYGVVPATDTEDEYTTYTILYNGNGNYQRCLAFFKVNLGEGVRLKDYANITAEVTANAGDSTYKDAMLLVSKTAWGNNGVADDTALKPFINSQLTQGIKGAGAKQNLVFGIDKNQAIDGDGFFTGEVYISIFANCGDSSGTTSITIGKVKFNP